MMMVVIVPHDRWEHRMDRHDGVNRNDRDDRMVRGRARDDRDNTSAVAGEAGEMAAAEGSAAAETAAA
jgi:hypothetical protein